MKIVRTLGMTFAISIFMACTVFAGEGQDSTESLLQGYRIDVKGTEVPQLREIVDLDPYEPNDTKETAFPYSQVEKMTITSDDYFQYGYTPISFHKDYDGDWFSVTLFKDVKYVIALKNVFACNRDIILHGYDKSGREVYEHFETGFWEPEVFHFTPDHTGTFYIQIKANKGTEGMWSWFAVARDGTIDERHWSADVKPPCSLQN